MLDNLRIDQHCETYHGKTNYLGKKFILFVSGEKHETESNK